MQLYIGSDHAGFEMKQFLTGYLKELGHFVQDLGTYSAESTDYPEYAHLVSEKVLEAHGNMGILLCGSANGVCMTANKHAGIRAALCWNNEIAHLARAHNDANILCIPARYMSNEDAGNMTREFLETKFEGGRHARRVEKINE